jgi:putative transposase
MGCGSSAISGRPEHTAQGFRRFRSRSCGKQFNERSWDSSTDVALHEIRVFVIWRGSSSI